MPRREEGDRDGLGGWGCHAHTAMYRIDDSREPALWYRELYSILSGDLNTKEVQGRGDICIHVADSFCSSAKS